MNYSVSVQKEIDGLFSAHPELKPQEKNILYALDLLIDCYAHGGKTLICGNGGSASDSEHIVGELMKGFKKRRPLRGGKLEALQTACPEDWEKISEGLQDALPAISLVSHTALMTAFLNDVDPNYLYAQQVVGYAKPGDVLIGISTSGNAANVCNAFRVAKALGMRTIGLTGKSGGRFPELCDAAVVAPAQETFAIQELHLPIYHMLCAAVEAAFFEE